DAADAHLAARAADAGTALPGCRTADRLSRAPLRAARTADAVGAVLVRGAARLPAWRPSVGTEAAVTGAVGAVGTAPPEAALVHRTADVVRYPTPAEPRRTHTDPVHAQLPGRAILVALAEGETAPPHTPRARRTAGVPAHLRVGWAVLTGSASRADLA